MATATARDDLDLRDYLAVIRRRRWLIAAILAAVLAVTLAVTFLQTPMYRATAEVLLRPRATEQLLSPDQGAQNPQLAQININTEVQVMKSASVRDAVAERLGFRPSVDIAPRAETAVVGVSAKSADADEAARIANLYASTYVHTRREALVTELLGAMDDVQAQIDELDAAVPAGSNQVDPDVRSRRANYVEQLDQLQLSSQLASGGAQLVSQASVPTAPKTPMPVRNASLGLVVGLVLAIGAAFVRDHLDDSLRTKEDLAKVSAGAPLLGMVPLVPDWKKRSTPRVVTVSAPRSGPAEAYRTLRTSLQFVGLEHSTHITQVTSPGPADGKTTTLSNLGVVLAEAGQTVLMVDGDLRRPRLHEFFGVDNEVGFTSLLLGTASPDDTVRRVSAHHRLDLLPSGTPPANPAELLASARSQDLLRDLAAGYDCVLVDGPPLLPVTDALVLARVATATVVVVAAERTRRTDAARAFEILGQIEAPVVGVVLNDVSAQSGYDGGYRAYASTYDGGHGRYGRRARRSRSGADRVGAAAAGAGADRARAISTTRS
jgi:capsular exopolysaccharide synthesis family protein